MFALMIVAALAAPPSCGPNGCPIPMVQSTPALDVIRFEGDAVTLKRLFADKVQIGSFDETTGRLAANDGREWFFKMPAPPVAQAQPLGQNVPTGGIAPGTLTPREGETFTLNGLVVDRSRAFQSLMPSMGSDLLDDSKSLRLTVIGSEDERRRVMSDLKTVPSLTAAANGLLVRDYASSSWAVADSGFKLDGKPTIYVQAPSGQVLHRQDDYEGGPERLAGAIRRARPDYDPKKDPDLSKPKEPPPAPPAPPTPVVPTPPTPSPAPPIDVPQPHFPGWLLAGVLALLGYLAMRRPSPATA